MTLAELKEQFATLPYLKQVERELLINLYNVCKTDNEKVLQCAINLDAANRKRAGEDWSVKKRKGKS